MAGLETGDSLPNVELALPDGGSVNLRTYLGKPLVLYFYPKDDTAGCTREAQDFSEHYAEFRALDAAVLGVSRDTPAKHRKFIDKYDLTVPLASDDKDLAMKAFDVWVEKKLYGREYMGIDRSTFLFDAKGALVRAWRRVRVPGHVAEVLEALKQLG